MRISCPPTISPCFYGVDTPSKKDLIAANKSIEEICQFIEADSLAYLSLPGLTHACTTGESAEGLSPESFVRLVIRGTIRRSGWMWGRFCLRLRLFIGARKVPQG